MSCLVIGAGGHARVVLDLLDRAGVSVDAILGGVVGYADILAWRASGSECFVVAIGDNGARRLLHETAIEADLAPLSIRCPTGRLSTSARVGNGVQLLPRVIVNAGAVIGDNVLLNTGAIIEHDCVIGSHSHIAPGAILTGGVTVGAGALIGAGAVVLPGVSVGDWATVGAGSVVTKDVPPGATVKGNPATCARIANEVSQGE